jgi:hypothetical protein
MGANARKRSKPKSINMPLIEVEHSAQGFGRRPGPLARWSMAPNWLFAFSSADAA